MRALIRRSLLLLPLIAAPAAASQPAAETERREIIVEGNRNHEARIAQFVDSLTQVHGSQGQLSRFEQTICPMAAGIPGEHRAALVNRIRQVATAVGIPVARSAKCAPNLLVIVTHDKQALMQLLERKRPNYFPGSWSNGRIRSFTRDPSPVAAWHIEGKLGRDGRDLTNDYSTGIDYQKTTAPPSRIYPGARPHFLGAIVVADIDALAGLTTTQFADYAAMRSFARTDPRAVAASSAPTILNIIDTPIGEEIPVTMTEWDFSFLKALYGSDGRNYAPTQRGEMKRLVRTIRNRRKRWSVATIAIAGCLRE